MSESASTQHHSRWVLGLVVAASGLIMRLLVRPMAMRLLHGCEEAAPLLDRVIGSLHPRQTRNAWELSA